MFLIWPIGFNEHEEMFTVSLAGGGGGGLGVFNSEASFYTKTPLKQPQHFILKSYINIFKLTDTLN